MSYCTYYLFLFWTQGLLEEDEGRKIMWGRTDRIPFTLVKTDGGFTYDTSDMATIKYRIHEMKADWIIYVVDAGQVSLGENCLRALEETVPL